MSYKRRDGGGLRKELEASIRQRESRGSEAGLAPRSAPATWNPVKGVLVKTSHCGPDGSFLLKKPDSAEVSKSLKMKTTAQAKNPVPQMRTHSNESLA